MQNNNIEIKKETDFDTSKLAKENNLNINFSNCLKSDNVNELKKVKNEVMNKVSKSMNQDKKEFEKSFNSFTNTTLGIDMKIKADLYEKNRIKDYKNK